MRGHALDRGARGERGVVLETQHEPLAGLDRDQREVGLRGRGGHREAFERERADRERLARRARQQVGGLRQAVQVVIGEQDA